MSDEIYYSRKIEHTRGSIAQSVEVHSLMDECTKLKAENDQLRDALAILAKSTIVSSSDPNNEALLWGHSFCHWLNRFEYSPSFTGKESVVSLVIEALGFKV